MAQKRGLIELRLDRRQAFYAVVGCLLIVSVAFVVGLIIGQRMQILDEPVAYEVVETSPARGPADGEPAAVAAADEPEPGYTFYDELREEPPRPLLMPSRGGIGEPAEAVRLLERQPPGQSDPAADQPAEPEPQPAEPQPAEPQPAEPELNEPAPPARRAPPAEPAVERVAMAEPEPAPRVEPIESEAPVRRVERRAVRRPADGTATPDEFGFFTVEAGRFDTFGAASDRRSQLRSQGHDAIVTIVAPASGEREYRVQIGSYTRRGDADEVAASVGRLGIRARVVQEG